MLRGPSIVIVSACPDDRPSTAELRDLVDALRDRGVRAELWFLRGRAESGRHDATLAAAPGTRVVDSLRTWLPAQLLDAFGLGPVADRLRGLRLRWWWTRSRARVVVLDDALGERVLPRTRPTVVVRRNDEAPVDAAIEVATERADLWILPPGIPDPADGAPVLRNVAQLDAATARSFTTPDRRETARRHLGVPTGRSLIVGWGDDTWFDGVDLFVRLVWLLEHHHGVVLDGAWLGQLDDEQLIREEAERCGIADRIHLRPRSAVDAKLCADVAVLPYRSEAEPVRPSDIAAVDASGLPTVAFPAAVAPHARTVPTLDLEAAATAVVDALADDRARRSERLAPLLDRGTVADALAELAVRQARR